MSGEEAPAPRRPAPTCARAGCGHDADMHGRRAGRAAAACLIPRCGCPDWVDPLVLLLDPVVDPGLARAWVRACEAVALGDGARGYAIMMAAITTWLRELPAGPPEP